MCSFLVSHTASSNRARNAPPLWLPSRIDGVELDAFELYAIAASCRKSNADACAPAKR